MQAVAEVLAVPGVGLEGDRYALKQGTFFKPEPDFELTLIEAEAVESAQLEHGLKLVPGDARRNLVTRGASLNSLVGHEFQIGNVRVRHPLVRALQSLAGTHRSARRPDTPAPRGSARANSNRRSDPRRRCDFGLASI